MSNPLNRYHQILQLVAGFPSGLSLAELSSASGLPRSSTHRLAASLKEIDYLAQDEATGNYLLGNALVKLARTGLAQDHRLELFTPALNFIVGRLEETAFCARLWNEEVDLVRAVTPARKDRAYIYPGVGARPMDRCSSSKAILAALDRDTAFALLDPILTPDVDKDHFLNELNQVSAQGFAVCDGEIDEGVFSVACPVFSGTAAGLYSIGVVGPSARLKAHDIDQVVAVLHSAAELAAGSLRNISPKN